MLKCKICNKEVKHDLCTHIRNSHKLSKNEYLLLFPNSEFFSEEICKARSEKTKTRWANPIKREKMCKSREGIYATKEWNDKRQKGYEKAKKEGRIKPSWNSGKTKEQDIRLKRIGEKNRDHLTGRTKENYEYLKQHSEWMKINSLFSNDNPTLQYTNEEKEQWKRKISKTLSTRIANGEVHFPSNRFKNGWFQGINGTYFYQSNLELETMMIFDSLDIIDTWTNKHGIKIEYEMSDKSIHFYIPDFYVVLKCGKKLVIEMKGFETEEVLIKEKYARELYKYNYFIFYDTITLKETLYELNKN